MTAGLQQEPSKAPTLNIEQLLSKKVMIIKLTSGELLIAAIFQSSQNGLNLTHPYEIIQRPIQLGDQWVEVPVIEPHCPYVVNRTFFISWTNMIYAKEATENFANLYLEEFERCENRDYTQLLTNYRNHIEAKQNAKAVVMIGDSLIRVDGDKIFVEGNETKH